MSQAPSRPRTPMTPYPVADQEAIRDLLVSMNQTLGALGQTFNTLNEQSARVTTISPAVDTTHQIQSLRRQMKQQEKKQEARIAEVKHMVRDVLKESVANHMRAQIAEQIRVEIGLQVKQQVQEQLKDHLPVSLEQQAAESKQQLAEVKVSLINSEARRANSVLRSSNLDDPLSVIVKADGHKSSLFPKDLKTLFGYDAATARALVKDYGLPEQDIREQNLNRFMAHIGVNFHLIPVPVIAESSSANALGITLS